MDENKEIIQKKINTLRSQIDSYKAIWLKTAKADKGALFPIDFLSTAATHRAMCLIEGFCLLIEHRNFICAAPLIRLLLDTLLRFYALWLIDQPHDLVMEVLEGKELRRVKDRDGKPLTDSYLVKKLSAEYPWIERVYRETSGYIHLSKKHYFNTVREVRDSDRSVETAIGPEDTSISDEIYDESLDAMIEISGAVLRYLYGWAHTKETAAVSTNAAKHNGK
jgi:hypothetical protein